MRSHIYLSVLGLLSLILYLGLTGLSKDFNWGEGYSERPILEYLAIYFSIFSLYTLACLSVFKSNWTQKTFWVLIAFGLLFRFAVLPSQQIQEDDVYRYLWDGKVFAHGINPFKFAPEEINQYQSIKVQNPAYFLSHYGKNDQNELAVLNDLKWESDIALRYMERINHPDVPTIYPPLAQYVFRFSQQINPDSLFTLRIMFLAFDLMGMVFIILALRALNLNQNFSLVYFWSPLMIKETYNSTHLDIIGISCLCASVYFLIRKRMVGSIFFLALSVLGKFYSAVLLPFYLQRSWFLAQENRQRGAATLTLHLILFCTVITVFYLPFIDIGGSVFEGLKTYSTHWQSNDSLFAILLYVLKNILKLGMATEIPIFGSSMIFAKSIMALVILGTVAYLITKQGPDTNSPEMWIRNIFMVIVLVFLVSPVQNPWYLCWTVPFLCIFHSRSLISLTGLIGLYYLDFYFDYQDITQYSVLVAWLEYTPFYIYLLWELTRSKKTWKTIE
ncbi:MAG: glycosyltransferase family 39 protein [Nitrospinales bacterium]|nr:glycosyltransferase family 39 protein [Nitrospinales bacterium]